MTKLFFFDIDGTLIECNKGLYEISKTNRQSFDVLKEKGHDVFLATGRCKCFITDGVMNYPFSGYVTCNGGYVEYKGKNVDEAITNACVALGIAADKLDYDVVEKGSNGFLGFGSKPAIIKARKNESVEDIVTEFLNKVFSAMELTVKLDIKVEEGEKENTININVIGDDMGILIGKRGQTLDSLQYLTSLVVNKGKSNYIRVKLDTEDYRKRRKETLENLARGIAYKVKKTRKTVVLEPMNPYERRIIHSALQGNKFVETVSEGEEPYRHVVVKLKRN